MNGVNFIPVINHNYRTTFKKDLFSVEELAYISKISEERKRIKTTSLSSSPSTSPVDLWHLTARNEHLDLYQLLSLLRGCRGANLFVLYVIYIRYASSTWVAEPIVITVPESRMLRFGRLRSRSEPVGCCRDRPPSPPCFISFPKHRLLFYVQNLKRGMNVSKCIVMVLSSLFFMTCHRPTNSFEFGYFSDTKLVTTNRMLLLGYHYMCI